MFDLLSVCLPRITRILLERKAKYGNLLVGDGVEEALDDSLMEALLLILIDYNDL